MALIQLTTPDVGGDTALALAFSGAWSRLENLSPKGEWLWAGAGAGHTLKENMLGGLNRRFGMRYKRRTILSKATNRRRCPTGAIVANFRLEITFARERWAERSQALEDRLVENGVSARLD